MPTRSVISTAATSSHYGECRLSMYRVNSDHVLRSDEERAMFSARVICVTVLAPYVGRL